MKFQIQEDFEAPVDQGLDQRRTCGRKQFLSDLEFALFRRNPIYQSECRFGFGKIECNDYPRSCQAAISRSSKRRGGYVSQPLQAGQCQ